MSFIQLSALNLPQSLDDLQRAIIDYSTPKNILLFTLGLSTSYLLYKFVKFYLYKRKYRHIPGPPTNGLFGYFVGNIPEINRAIKNGRIMHDLFVEWHETYGEVFKFQMFNRIMLITSDKNTIREALITKSFPKDDYMNEIIAYPLGERLLGQGLVTELDHEKWKNRRALFNPGFHRQYTHIIRSILFQSKNFEEYKLSFDGLQDAIIDYSTPKNALLFSLGLSTSYFLYKIVKFYLTKRKYRHIPGPSTEGVFGYFLGNVSEVRREIKKGKVIPDLLVKWHETYGEVFKFQMYNKIIVVTSDKNTIRDALITRNFPKSSTAIDKIAIPFGQRFLGRGLVTGKLF